MIPPFDPDGDLPQGVHQATWPEFRERFCIFARSGQRLSLCQRIAQMVEEARASRIVERVIFGGSFEGEGLCLLEVYAVPRMDYHMDHYGWCGLLVALAFFLSHLKLPSPRYSCESLSCDR